MSESAEISMVGLPIPHLYTMKFFLQFKSNLRSLRFLMINFAFKYSKNNDFSRYILF